jgi:streptogrisin C
MPRAAFPLFFQASPMASRRLPDAGLEGELRMVHGVVPAKGRTALIAAGALMLTGLCPVAAADPPPAGGSLPGAAHTLGADRPPAQLVAALGRDLGLTPEQAAARLVNEAEAGARAGRLRNALGERFAGAWVSGATSAVLTVATTAADDVSAIRAQGAMAAVVKRSLADLTAVKHRLDAAAAGAEALKAPVWYVDVPANRVVVEAPARSDARAFIEAAGVSGVAVRVSAGRPSPLADVVGGDAFHIEDRALCSIGVSVTREREPGFVTAGHCGEAGETTTGHDRTAQGVFRASTFPGRDMAWVGVNDDWTTTADVRAEGGRRMGVAGSVEALVGASVCRSGATTGWRCGIIQQHDASVRYARGAVDGLTRTTACAEPGDSGGPFVAGAQAQGVTSGGSGDCESGGTTFYQPVNVILAEYGLTLRTTAAATAPAPAPNPDPVPPPQDGTADVWSAGRVYAAGATVTHDGIRYRCLGTHQAQTAWPPAATPALWETA